MSCFQGREDTQGLDAETLLLMDSLFASIWPALAPLFAASTAKEIDASREMLAVRIIALARSESADPARLRRMASSASALATIMAALSQKAK